jgi:hypothetical protein
MHLSQTSAVAELFNAIYAIPYMFSLPVSGCVSGGHVTRARTLIAANATRAVGSSSTRVHALACVLMTVLFAGSFVVGQ